MQNFLSAITAMSSFQAKFLHCPPYNRKQTDEDQDKGMDLFLWSGLLTSYSTGPGSGYSIMPNLNV